MSLASHPHIAAAAAMDGEETELWRTLRAEQSEQARHRLFERYLPLARRVAGRHFRDRKRGDIDYCDLVQWGCAGLLEAIDRFDPERGIAFSAYARKRIAGSIVDGIAKASEFREQLAFYKRHQADRMQSVRSQVGSVEIAESYDAFAEMVVNLAMGFLLEEPAVDKAGHTNAYESLAWKETVQAVHSALNDLPERERFILRGHYEAMLGFEELATMLGVSKGRVSQIHRAALLTLRKRLKRINPFTFSG